MTALKGQILTLPKMSGSISTPKSLNGNINAKTINIGGKGEDGATFIPFVSADGIISWTNDKELSNPKPVNIKGVKGDKGDKGDRGEKGDEGKDGYTPVKGVDYFDGVNGKDGKDGTNGKDGVDGYTPVKGIDYFTEADKEEIVSAVISSLPVYNGEAEII